MRNITSVREWNYCFNLLFDESVSEIESNGPGQFFVKYNGKFKHLNKIQHSSEDDYLRGIEEGLVPFVRSHMEYKANSYLFEGPLYLKDGNQIVRGRCHIVLPPASDYPIVTIAKKTTKFTSLESIAEGGSMSREMYEFLKIAIQSKLSIVFSGKTGAGKTTMLEACAKLIPDSTRIGVAEDIPELQLPQTNVFYQHSFPWQPGMDPNNVATLSWVVAQFQRQRVDRIIVGETRGKEFADFLTAANSGMEGSLTTIHGNNPTRALDKMMSFALKGSTGNVPVRSINSDIANAVDIIVQLGLTRSGRHVVQEILEVTSALGNEDDAKISTNSLYIYNDKDAVFEKVGNVSDIMRNRILDAGCNLEPILQNSIGNRERTQSSNISHGIEVHRRRTL
jgi:pilus assembly protein CpaF